MDVETISYYCFFALLYSLQHICSEKKLTSKIIKTGAVKIIFNNLVNRQLLILKDSYWLHEKSFIDPTL